MHGMNKTPVAWIVLLMLALVPVTQTGCATDKQIIAQAADAHKEINPAVLNDPVLAGYVQAIGQRIVDVAREMSDEGYGPKAHKQGDNEWMFKDIQFHLVNSPTLNAFTTGGQHIYLYTELFTTAKTEDEFAAVVAHEFGHIYGRHVQKGTNRQYAALGVAALGAVGGAALAGENSRLEGAALGGGVGLVAAQFANMGFTRDDEDEADKLGFAFYTRAGWDPNRFADFFQQMIDKGYDTTPEMLSDHPKLANRVANTKRRVSELPPHASSWRKPNVAGPQKFAEYQARARKLAKNAPKDKTLEAAQLMLAAFPSCVAPVEQPTQKQARTRLAQEAERQQKQKEKAR